MHASSTQAPRSLRTVALAASFAALLLVQAGCSIFDSAPAKSKPLTLPANPAQQGAQLAWRANVGTLPATATASVVQNQLFMVNAAGEISVLNAQGQVQTRASLGAAPTTGVGSDGKHMAAVTRDNDLLVFAQGKEVWRQRLPAQSYTTPVVAGERVFVLLADRSVMAFDGENGAKLWHLQRSSTQQDTLVLKHPGTLLAMGNTLVAGVGPRLYGINPNSAQLQWDIPVANPRSTNEVERLVDVVDHAYRAGAVLCARAYQAAVACIDTQAEKLLWVAQDKGIEGLGGDRVHVFGADTDGRVRAWLGQTGQLTWTNEKLLFRNLSAPTAWADSVALGDSSGKLFFLKPTTGDLLEYQDTDGSGVRSTTLLGEQLIVITRAGGVFAYKAK